MQSITSAFIMVRQKDISDRRGEGNVAKEVEIGIMQPEGKEWKKKKDKR